MAINEFTSFGTTMEDDAFVPPEDDEEFNLKLDLLSDKDILVQHLDTYKEHMDNRLQNCEKVIRSAITKEWATIETSLSTNQHARNRSIVKEMIETCQDFRKNLKEIFDRMRDEFDNE